MAASSGASFRGEGAHRDGTARAASFHSDFAASIGGAEVDELLILDGRFDVGTLTREQLVHELARRELDTSGTKAVLASRFVSYVTDKLAWRVADAIGTVQQKLDLTEQEQRGSLYVAGKLVDIVDGEGPAHAFHLCHQFRGVPVAELAAGTDFALILTSMQQVFIIALPGSPCAVHTSKKLPPLVPIAFRGALNTAATDFMAAKTLGEATRHTAATNNSGAGIGAPTATRLNNTSLESLAATPFSSNLLDSSVGNGHTVSRTVLEPRQLQTGGSWTSLRHDAGAASVYETERQDAAVVPHALHEGAGVGPEHKRTAQGVSALLPSTNASMLAAKRPLPIVIVPGTEGEHVNHIFAAGSYASAVSEGGDAFMWGSGRLGYERLTAYPERATTNEASLLAALQETPVDVVSAGDAFGVSISRADRQLYVWGSNERGCLGFTPSIHETNANIPQEDTWVHALDASAPSRPLSAMYTTHARSPVTLADTTSADNVAAAYMEQLASPKAHPFFATSHLPVRHVACGAQHVLVCTYSRVSPVFAWGAGTGFVLGLGDCSDRLTPALVSSFVNMTVHSVQTAGQCSYAIVDRQDMMKALFKAGAKLPPPPSHDLADSDSLAHQLHVGIADEGAMRSLGIYDVHDYSGTSVVAWGTGSQGQLGLGSAQTQARTPTMLPYFEETHESITMLSCSTTHVAAVSAHGDLFVWGNNSSSCLGLGSKMASTKIVYSPTRILQFNAVVTGVGRGRVRACAVGEGFTLISTYPYEGAPVSLFDAVNSHAALAEDDMEVAAALAKQREDEEQLLLERRRENDLKQKATFMEQTPCGLCAMCTGFTPDMFAPTLCRQCGHLKARHRTETRRRQQPAMTAPVLVHKMSAKSLTPSLLGKALFHA